MPRKRIFFVINSLAGGGAERVLVELVSASRELQSRYEFSLVLLDDEPRAYPVPDWVTVHQLQGRFKLLASFAALHKLAKAERPDLTLSFLTRSNLVCVAVAKLLGFRTVISERVNTSSHFSGGITSTISKAMVRLAYPRAGHVIAVSAGIAEDLSENFKVDAKRISAIPNPVNIARITAAAAQPVTLPVEGPFAVAISRLSTNKNAIMLVDALAESGLDLPLVILGQGPERDAILSRAATLGLSDRVIMPGFVENPYPILGAASCYLSASNAEGFPNGLVEALALGIPSVMTNCPSGPSEILADVRRETVHGLHAGDYGLLVPQDDVAAMAQAIRMIREPERAAHYAAAGRRRAAEFSVEKATTRYWDAIESVLQCSTAGESALQCSTTG